jgi:outer membrane immunogenic protein
MAEPRVGGLDRGHKRKQGRRSCAEERRPRYSSGSFISAAFSFLAIGLAVGNLRYDEVFIDPSAGSLGSESASFSKVKTGWTAGAGFEVALAPNWTAKAEYLHTEFGSESVTVLNVAAEPNVHRVARYQIDIARLGLNYRFAPRN